MDIDGLIAAFGGPKQLSELMNAQGIRVSASAIYKWMQRGSVPAKRARQIASLAQSANEPLDARRALGSAGAFAALTTDAFEASRENEGMSETDNSAKGSETGKDSTEPRPVGQDPKEKGRVYVFDTTLRDGEQSPGAAMTKEEKLRIALQLEKLGVDVIEAGFAASSKGDFEAISAISQALKATTVCALARAVENDVRRAGESVANAVSGRIHTFIATSPIHMEYKLKMKPDQVVKRAVEAIKIAKEYTDNIEFSCEDATRSDVGFLIEICNAAAEAGASTINLPDTVGYSVPHLTEAFFRRVIEGVKGSDNVIWSAHCHDDLGLSVANSIAAILGGARQVECTINGLGERAGNASLEEIVMTLKTRADLFNLRTGIRSKLIVPTSRLVSTITGYAVQNNKAIVGANAFTHESGIHQDGVLKRRETYEIMDAQSVGWDANHLKLGKLSGRNAFKSKLLELGIQLESEEMLNEAFSRFKDLADKKRDIYDQDLHAIVSDMQTSDDDSYKLLSMKIVSETGEKPYAQITFSNKGHEFTCESSGTGPVDALFKAIESEAKSGADLQLYQINALTLGAESQGDVTVRLSDGERIANGQGSDTDVLVASAKAYLAALSKLAKAKEGGKNGAEVSTGKPEQAQA